MGVLWLGSHLPCHCACVASNFMHTWSFILDAFFVPCFSSCVKIKVLHICSWRLDVLLFIFLQVSETQFCVCYHFKTDVFLLPCNSPYFNLSFLFTCSWIVLIFAITCHSCFVKPNLVKMWRLRWVYYVSVVVLRVLN